ncbi:MAG: hydroxymethylglutaryl-CoA lyase [Elusimicrobiota bacterium]|nr:MAG: hydroxymethylglutaryl-CoA lyase [Elusimicrobiota bacterium]
MDAVTPKPRPAPRLVEVGPRDGLQSENKRIPLDVKVAFIDALSETGLKEIEAGAFVNPKAVPQMADSQQVFARIKRKPGVIYSALVPNETGLDLALACKADKISVFTAATESFNQANIKASIKDSIERFRPVVLRTRQAKLPTRGYVSTAFWCPYEGAVKPEKVVEVVKMLSGIGVTEFSIGDTIGKASPDEVRRLLFLLCKVVEKDSIFLHFHNTFGRAVANSIVAWKTFGISGYDSSAGGVGGCPYAPGATGNVATEALVSAFESAGARPASTRPSSRSRPNSSSSSSAVPSARALRSSRQSLRHSERRLSTKRPSGPGVSGFVFAGGGSGLSSTTRSVAGWSDVTAGTAVVSGSGSGSAFASTRAGTGRVGFTGRASRASTGRGLAGFSFGWDIRIAKSSSVNAPGGPSRERRRSCPARRRAARARRCS